MSKHTHKFTKRKPSSKVATCRCGAFQHVGPQPADIITEVPPMNLTKHTPGPWHKERNASPHSVYPYRIRHDNGDGTTRDIGEVWHLDDARLIAAAPEMRDSLSGFANRRDDGRCASCNAEIAPEGYCGCAESSSGTVEWRQIRAARALLARIDGTETDPRTGFCKFCRTAVTRDNKGSWIDATEGDCCPGSPTGMNENEPHQLDRVS